MEKFKNSIKDKYMRFEEYKRIYNSLKEEERQSKENKMKLKKHMILTNKLKEIENGLKELDKQFHNLHKPNMSPSAKEELMLISQEQKKLKDSMEKILAQIHHESSDVSIKDNYNEKCYPNLEDKINSYKTFMYNCIDVDKLFSL
jgi:hypothetical protein